MSAQAKQNFHRTEAGDIPRDWSVVTLSQVSTPVRGGSPRPAGDPRYFNGSFIPWLTVASLTNIPDSQMIVSETISQLTEEGALHSRTLNEGTLIIANSGATLGVAKVLGIRCCANDGIAALLNVSNKVAPLYLAHFINSRTTHLRQVVATGNGQPNLNTTLIGDITVPLPPTATEQSAIASALSDIDALINGLDHLIAKKRDIRQAVMLQLLTGQRRLPGFSGEWAVKRLGELFSFSGGLSASRDQLSDTGHLYLHYGDIHKSSNTVIHVENSLLDIPRLNVHLPDVNTSSLLKDGDVVFVDASEDENGVSKHLVIVNPLDRPYISGLHTIVAKPRGDGLAHTFKRYCFQTPAIRSQFRFFAAGTKVSGVSKTSIAKIELSFPSVREQTAIATVLSDMDTELAVLEARRDKARQLKQGMMQELLTGRIRLV